MKIEISCSKAQFERIIFALNNSAIQPDGKCVLGKNQNSCPAINGKEPELTCSQCIKRNVKHVTKGGTRNG